MKKIILGIALALSFAPAAFAQDVTSSDPSAQTDPTYPYQQTFTITAYYSPIEGQTRYLRGSLEADKKLNGNGVHGADGTPVFAGMIAAPKTIPFGTKMEIPGIGIVSVHDRGGAIVAAAAGSTKHDRLDVWMGSGDQGLNRALAWGKRTITVTVYGPDDNLAEKIDLSGLDTLTTELSTSSFEQSNFQLFRHDFGYGDNDPEIQTIQGKLALLGYYSGATSTTFDQKTYQAVLKFQIDYNIIDSASDFGAGYFGPQTRKTLEKALNGQTPAQTNTTPSLLPPALAAKADSETRLVQLAGNGLSFLKADLKPGDNGQSVIELQTELKKLNYLGIDPTGNYGDVTTHAVFKFQQSQGIIQSETDLGAGIAGPQTRNRLAEIVAARVENREKLNQKVQTLVAKK